MSEADDFTFYFSKPSCVDLTVEAPLHSMELNHKERDVIFGEGRGDRRNDNMSLYQSITSEFPELRTSPRNHFKLYKEYTQWLLEGRKTTTIRYDENGVDLADRPVLPLIVTCPSESFQPYPIDTVDITGITIKQFANLNEEDAVKDGFKSLSELKSALRSIYDGIKGEDLVTIYNIKPRNLRDGLRE